MELMMSEFAGVVVLFLATLQERNTPKYLIEVLTIVASLALWWAYYPGVALYPGIALTAFVSFFTFRKKSVDLDLKYLPVLILISTSPVTSLLLLSALSMLLYPALRGTHLRSVLTILILVSFLSVGQQVNQYQLSIFMLIFAVAQSFISFWGKSRRSEERRVGKECRSRWSPDR